jgi:hypothetical protein
LFIIAVKGEGEGKGKDIHFIGTGDGMDGVVVVDVWWKKMKRCW